jgi:hypothetical protein
MKIRILSIACVTAAAAVLAACTAVYKNSDACEQMMRSQLAEKSTDTLKIDHTGAGIDGSRVVVEGSIVHLETAAAPVTASSATAAARAASATAAAAVPASATGASGAIAATGASGASVTSVASVASVASEAAAPAKSAKPQKTLIPAAGECTFHGPTLSAFNWLAPEKYLPPADNAAE